MARRSLSFGNMRRLGQRHRGPRLHLGVLVTNERATELRHHLGRDQSERAPRRAAPDVRAGVVEEREYVLCRVAISLEPPPERLRQPGRLDLAVLALERGGEAAELRDAPRAVDSDGRFLSPGSLATS